MKWYNETKLKMVDTSFVNGYVYIPLGLEMPSGEKSTQHRLEIILSGSPYVFVDDEAVGLYNAIKSENVQLLNG